MKRPVAILLLALGAPLVRPGAAHADDKADCIAALEAAQNLRSDGKLTMAIAKFAVCGREVCPHSMQKLCVDQAAEASGLLPGVVLSATDASGKDLVDVRVSVDGTVIATMLDGKAIAIDPGLHTFRFEKDGAEPVEQKVAIKEGQKGQPVSARLAPTEAPAAVAPTPAVAPPPLPPPAAVPAVAPAGGAKSSWSTLRWTGVGVGGAGVTAIVVGSVFGAKAFSSWSEAEAQCPAPRGCAPGSQAYTTKSNGETDATVSTVFFVAGGVLAAGGVAMFLLAPSSKSTARAVIVPSPGGASITGSF